MKNSWIFRPLTLKAIGGRLIVDKLDEEDHDKIKEFLKLVKLPMEDMDFYNPEEVVKYSMKLKSHKDNLLTFIRREQCKTGY